MCLALLMPLQASANQLYYNKQHLGGDIKFYYKWQDNKRNVQKLNFALPAYAVDDGAKEFKPINNQDVKNYIFKGIKKYISQKGYRIDVVRNYESFDFRSDGRITRASFNAQVDNVQQQIPRLEKQFFKERMYTVYGNNFMPNHKAIAKKYVSAMRPVASAMSANINTKNSRELVNYVLNFMQSIPYDILKNRYSSNGAGFQTPYGLLLGNRGDCDTKSVAAAAILRNFFPRQRIIMVYVPGHAFVGFNFRNPRSSDEILRIGGTDFILAEPVGPRLASLGTIAESSKALLRSGKYSYQEVPF